MPSVLLSQLKKKKTFIYPLFPFHLAHYNSQGIMNAAKALPPKPSTRVSMLTKLTLSKDCHDITF